MSYEFAIGDTASQGTVAGPENRENRRQPCDVNGAAIACGAMEDHGTGAVRVLVLMGVSGCGKSTVGQRLAELGKRRFLEGDDFHPRANLRKMSRGEPLGASDRAGWITRLVAAINADGEAELVVACSALTESIRQRLLRETVGECRIVYLKADRATIRRRLREREGHFMKAAMLESQFEALEEPRGVLVVDATTSVEELCRVVMTRLGT